MQGTGTFLERASSAVVLGDEDDEDPRLRCDGCGEMFFDEELSRGDAGTWCSGCRENAPEAWAPFDCVEEDDGEP